MLSGGTDYSVFCASKGILYSIWTNSNSTFQSVCQEDVNSEISYYQGISAKEIHIAKIMMLSEKKSCNNSMRS